MSCHGGAGRTPGPRRDPSAPAVPRLPPPSSSSSSPPPSPPAPAPLSPGRTAGGVSGSAGIPARARCCPPPPPPPPPRGSGVTCRRKAAAAARSHPLRLRETSDRSASGASGETCRRPRERSLPPAGLLRRLFPAGYNSPPPVFRKRASPARPLPSAPAAPGPSRLLPPNAGERHPLRSAALVAAARGRGEEGDDF